MNSIIIVTCGGTAGDIRQELGTRCKMKKVQHGESVGNYGDFVFKVSDANAVSMKMKYPEVVHIIP